jgi:cytochrome b561
MEGRLASWEAVVVRWNHWLLYIVMLVMPLSGYILATAAVRPSPYFWLLYWPQPPLVPWLSPRQGIGARIGRTLKADEPRRSSPLSRCRLDG